jgi:hypothetical protein
LLVHRPTRVVKPNRACIASYYLKEYIMSTLNVDPRAAHRPRTALGVVLVAVGALVAAAVAVVALAVPGARRTTRTESIAPQGPPPVLAVQSDLARTVPPGYVRDPSTHALLRVRSTGSGDRARAEREHSYGEVP